MTRKKSPRKQSVRCPHCGQSQPESIHAQSTFCRHCGQHYQISGGTPEGAPGEIELRPGGEPPQEKTPALAAVAAGAAEQLFGGLTPQGGGSRELYCFECGAASEVSAQAQSSICPRCSAYIDLSDVTISGVVSRSVRTHGRLVIEPKGSLSCTRAAAGEAFIEGGMDSFLVCYGAVQIRRKGLIRGSIHAKSVEIARKSEVRVLGAIHAENVIIKGELISEVHATGGVGVERKAKLVGDVRARAFQVAKGAHFQGRLEIGTAVPPDFEATLTGENQLTRLPYQMPGQVSLGAG